ncbi:MAG: ribonuclease [Bryobacterales bacterium]|nr:ribonuclease [Bryobacterales bacterium]
MASQTRRISRPVAAAILACLLAASVSSARSHKKRGSGGEGTPSFAYYVLALSYAPDFCAQPAGDKNPRECGQGRHVGFVVHGLWPQGESGRGPERCGSVSPVSQDLVRFMLNYVPTESLIQHEWADHGSCTGLSAGDYFSLIRKARDSIALPDELKAPTREVRLSPEEIAAKLAAANPGYPPGAFRVSCYRDGELQEVRICLNKDLSPRTCSNSAGGCAERTLLIRPVR